MRGLRGASGRDKRATRCHSPPTMIHSTSPGVNLPRSDNEVAVSIVVPVRNEAENIAPLIAEIAAALDGRWPYEIVYVNDGSTDATADRLADEMKRRGNLRQLCHKISAGQSAAVRSGVRAARGNINAT